MDSTQQQIPILSPFTSCAISIQSHIEQSEIEDEVKDSMQTSTTPIETLIHKHITKSVVSVILLEPYTDESSIFLSEFEISKNFHDISTKPFDIEGFYPVSYQQKYWLCIYLFLDFHRTI